MVYEFITNTYSYLKATWEVAGPALSVLFSILAWLWAKKASRGIEKARLKAEALAAQPITIILEAEGRFLLLPWKPARREVTTRAGLFGAIGAVAGARRFDLGHGLLKLVTAPEFEAMLRGETNELAISCPIKEMAEFEADIAAFVAGDVRQQPKPAFQPKPATFEQVEANLGTLCTKISNLGMLLLEHSEYVEGRLSEKHKEVCQVIHGMAEAAELRALSGEVREAAIKRAVELLLEEWQGKPQPQ